MGHERSKIYESVIKKISAGILHVKFKNFATSYERIYLYAKKTISIYPHP